MQIRATISLFRNGNRDRVAITKQKEHDHKLSRSRDHIGAENEMEPLVGTMAGAPLSPTRHRNGGYGESPNKTMVRRITNGSGYVDQATRLSSAVGFTPSRTSSPSAGILDQTAYWAVTKEAGCIPSMSVAYHLGPNGEPLWWGGRFPAPLDEFEKLVDDLPIVLATPEELVKRIEELPEMELFASSAQRASFASELTKSTGQGHSDACRASPRRVSELRPVVVCHGDVDRERAFALFAYLANAFVFSRTHTSTSNPISLPGKISVPLLRLSQAVGRKPITDYASCVLNNWTLRDIKQGFKLENIEVLRTFTGLEAEKWFYAIHAVIEHIGGLALVNMKEARRDIEEFLIQRKLALGEDREANKRAVALQRLLGYSRQFSATDQPGLGVTGNHVVDAAKSTFDDFTVEKAASVARYLSEIEKSLEGIYETMKRLPERCPAEVFYFQIRQWVSSWPDAGVVYETYCNCGYDESKGLLTAQKHSGASGAQSSLLPSIDGFLGIAYGHKQNVEATPTEARTDLGAFIRQLKGFRLSMPTQHRELIARFESQGNVHEFIAALEEHTLRVSTEPTSNKQTVAQLQTELNRVKTKYNDCIEQLTLFRKTHMDFAVKFIKSIAPKRPDTGGQAAIKGTGGSDFAKHLNQHITDTRKSLYEVSGTTSTATTPSLALPPDAGGVVTSKLSLPAIKHSEHPDST